MEPRTGMKAEDIQKSQLSLVTHYCLTSLLLLHNSNIHRPVNWATSLTKKPTYISEFDFPEEN